MKRRAFMQLLGAATLVWPRAGVAQQSNSPQRASGVAGGSFQWTRMPSTALRPVLPTKAQLGAAWGVEGPSGLIGDWTTAGLSGHKLILAAQGGHAGYGGNETYEINFDSQTAKRLCDPAPYPPRPWATPPIVPAFGPVANHGYDGVQVCPLDGKLYMWGTYGFDPTLGYGTVDGKSGLYYQIAQELWVCDLTKMPDARAAWTKRAGMPIATSPYSAIGGQFAATWVPEKNQFLCFYNGSAIWYDPVADKYSAWYGSPRTSVYGASPTGCYVAHRREVWWICDGSVIAAAAIDRPNPTIKLMSFGARTDLPPGVSGQNGWSYDPASKQIVIWPQRGDLWFLNPDTLEWRHFVPASGATSPNSPGVPVYGKFRVIPDIRTIVALVDLDGLWTMKLGDVLALPVWTRPAASVRVTNPDGSKFGPYANVQLAHDAATTQHGATITIAAPPPDPGFWIDQATITKNGIKLIGAAGCKIKGGLVEGGVGAFSIKGNDFFADSIEGFGCRGDGSASFFRLAGANATFGPGIYLHDNDMGILAGTNFDSTVTLNGCRFSKNGLINNEGRAHNIYIGQVKLLVAKDITTVAAIDGHCLKSRSLGTQIVGGTFDGRDSTTSRMIDIPWGGTVHISGATLFQGPTNNIDMIGINLESGETLPPGVTRTHSTLIENCVATTKRKPAMFVNSRSPAPVEVKSCTIHTVGSFTLGKGTVKESGNTID